MSEKKERTTIIIHPTTDLANSLAKPARLALPVAGTAAIVWAGRKAIQALRLWRRTRPARAIQPVQQNLRIQEPSSIEEGMVYEVQARVRIVKRRHKTDE